MSTTASLDNVPLTARDGAAPALSVESATSPLRTSPQVFFVKQLTVQFFFSRNTLLSISLDAVSVATQPEEWNVSSKQAVLDEEDLPPGTEFEALDTVDEIIYFDIGKLLEDQVEDASLIFQFNTRTGVHVFQALSEEQKAEIAACVRKATSEKHAMPLEVEANDQDEETVSSIEHSLEHYTTLCDTYEVQLQSIKSLESKWTEVHETNTTLVEMLEEMQHRNEMLAARLEDANRSSQDAADKIATMQRRMDEKRRLLKEKGELLQRIGERITKPDDGIRLQWRHVAAGAGALLFTAFVAHYIWLVLVFTRTMRG
ncbi:uncharacterized protein SPPG_00122 [Spizellomyces punctatus DAOM BR117]|uniref:Uncharacterized protein n=1 Tax=Spizellomyces punctatus (strain DAOM BR117) TaxID=645134 RepID=A0A0L0HSP8_SPIPD|nr:uncharacterized protein SPPG_00122 [Spizellomyces punctatus DAOM BR117]KND04391.1 hypothetical protein SPPG_00122 [Spizellomyces punctatus DAOM BR117]|eukprot:XP_016612430.1 hypothetical protein SPPG_00122 [Spizellomyces punctatus DAOM BR117]